MSLDSKTRLLRIAVVEDMRDARESLVFLINAADGMACVSAVASAEEALDQFPVAQPDLVLLDIHLAGEMSGTACIQPLKELLPAVQVVIWSEDNASETVFACLRRGAIGYIHKNLPSERLPDALRQAAAGGSPISPDIARLVTAYFQRLEPQGHEWERLSEREQEVLRFMSQGFLKKEIAARLGISEETVRTHCRNIYKKLEVGNRHDAVAKVVPGGEAKLTAKRR